MYNVKNKIQLSKFLKILLVLFDYSRIGRIPSNRTEF